MTTQVATITTKTPLAVALKSVDFMPKVAKYLAAFNINPDLFQGAVMFDLNAQPKLGKCTWGSFLQALRSSAITGLIPGKLGGKCYLIPYGDECQFQLSYKGMIEIFGRHKIRVRPVTVRENDIFEYDFGGGAVRNHQVIDWDNRGEIKLIYVVYTFSDGTIQVNEPMTKRQIDRVRDNHSQAYQYGLAKKDSIWHKHYDIMAIKTAIKFSSKFIQVPHEVAQALAMDDLADRRANAIETTGVPISNNTVAEIANESEQQDVITDGVNQTTGEIEGDFEVNPDAAAAAQGRYA